MKELSVRNSMEIVDRDIWDKLENIIQYEEWGADELVSEKLLKDGKVLTLESVENDFVFLSFYLYGKNRSNPLTKGTIQEYKRDMRLLLSFLARPADYFEQAGMNDLPPQPCSLKSIGRSQLRGFTLYLNKRYSKNTSVRKLSLLKGLLRFGYEKGFFQYNLRDEFSSGQPVRAVAERKLNYEEIQYVLDELKKKPLHRIIGSLLLLKGLRVSELCSLSNGDCESGLYGDTIVKIMRKGGKQTRKKLPKQVMYDIMIYRESLAKSLQEQGKELDESPEGPLVPNSNGRRLTRDRVWDIVKRAAKRASINHPVLKRKADKFSPHWFRHSFATIALDSGANIVDVKDELGHSDIRTTQIYLHSLKEETGRTLADLITTKITI